MFLNPDSASVALGKPAPLRVGLLGLGTVGTGVYTVLQRNGALIAARAGRPIQITMVATRNTARAACVLGQGMLLGSSPARAQPRLSATQARSGLSVLLVRDALAVIDHPEIDVVVEAIGGTTLAKDLVLRAIARGKHVVTANKALLAEHGDEVFAAADRAGVIVAYEGAVAVSIPIIKALREGLSANRIEWLAGIVNGTSNFVLTAMQQDGLHFEAALAQAQALGYAEADPELDVNGTDAAHKLALLASIAFGTRVAFSDIPVEGITALTHEDMACARQLDLTVKLLAMAEQNDQGMVLRVQPRLLPADHMLAQVDGRMNAVMVKGDASGITLHCGAGAGGEQTGSAVIADLVDVARTAGMHAHQRVPSLGFGPQAMRDLPLLPTHAWSSRFCLRMNLRGLHDATSLALGADVLIAHGVRLERSEILELAGARSAVLLTHAAPEALVREAVTAWEKQANATGQVRMLRIGLDH